MSSWARLSWAFFILLCPTIRHSRKGLQGPFKPRASPDELRPQESNVRLLVRPVCSQSTCETPTYRGESWWG